MDIEDELGFEMDENFGNRLIEDGTTFIEFIQMVEQRSSRLT